MAHKVILESFIYRVLVSNCGPQNHGEIAKLLGNAVSKIYSGTRRANKIKAIEAGFKYNGGKKYVAT